MLILTVLPFSGICISSELPSIFKHTKSFWTGPRYSKMEITMFPSNFYTLHWSFVHCNVYYNAGLLHFTANDVFWREKTQDILSVPVFVCLFVFAFVFVFCFVLFCFLLHWTLHKPKQTFTPVCRTELWWKSIFITSVLYSRITLMKIPSLVTLFYIFRNTYCYEYNFDIQLSVSLFVL